MMKRIVTLLAMLLANNLNARTAQEYLPPDSVLDGQIPTPESQLGWEVGDWHISHDKLVQYLQTLTAASSRVSIRTIGYTHEQRPLLQLIITSAENQQNLESLRRSHLEGEGPLVIWLGYGAHGDEPSGSNAALLTSYYLAASQSSFVEELLAGSIIVIDPSINPDGINRFASWANSNAAKLPVTDPITRQHVQNWPDGRTNHYWFDLNRDWLPLVQPESRARIVEYHRWLPHVLTDHHEQERHPGFFFQPGVPSRQNPLTPAANLELTRALTAYHSEAMDAAGQPYFTEEAYDDFYYGKGSTYPDINGSIGILFEQRAILGQALSTSNGIETFPMAIANHLRMSLSTLTGAWALRERLKQYQAGFADSMLKQASDRDYRGWLVGDDGDPMRAREFLDVLDLHRIEYQPLAETVRVGANEYRPGQAWVIPARQRQFGLLEALMERRTAFEDTVFYDVSAWTLPLAYNLPFATLRHLPSIQTHPVASSGLPPDRDAPAWAVSWNQLAAPQLLQSLLAAGAKPRVALAPFSARTSTGLRAFRAGTLIVQAGIQADEDLPVLFNLLSDAALSGLRVDALSSSLTPVGPDLGSRNFALIREISPLIVGGRDTSACGAGEIWHLLDNRLGVPAPIIGHDRLTEAELDNYSHLLLADGDFSSLGDDQAERLRLWVQSGGILVAIGRAAAWVGSLCLERDPELCLPIADQAANSPSPAPRPYADFEKDTSQQLISGAIFSAVIDLSHPLAFGYVRPDLPVFRKGTTELEAGNNAYSTPVRYTSSPLLAGYIGEERLAAISGQPAVIADKRGDGLVVRFANDPLFRGFWRGTERMYVNALYFGQVIEARESPE